MMKIPITSIVFGVQSRRENSKRSRIPARVALKNIVTSQRQLGHKVTTTRARDESYLRRCRRKKRVYRAETPYLDILRERQFEDADRKFRQPVGCLDGNRQLVHAFLYLSSSVYGTWHVHLLFWTYPAALIFHHSTGAALNCCWHIPRLVHLGLFPLLLPVTKQIYW